jgi:hypothetical protein
LVNEHPPRDADGEHQEHREEKGEFRLERQRPRCTTRARRGAPTRLNPSGTLQRIEQGGREAGRRENWGDAEGRDRAGAGSAPRKLGEAR